MQELYLVAPSLRRVPQAGVFVFQIIVYRADVIAQANASLVKGGGFCEAKDGGIIIKYNPNRL